MGPVGLSSGAVCVPSIKISWTPQGPLVISLRTFILPSGNALSHVMANAVASLALVALKPPGALNLMSSAWRPCSVRSSCALNAATNRSVVSLTSGMRLLLGSVSEAEGPRGLLPSSGRQPRGLSPPPQSRNSHHYTRNGCVRVLIFRDPTPPPAFRRRGRRRAQRIGGLCAPAAAEEAPVRNQGRNRVGHPARRSRCFQAHAPPPRPAAQARGERGWRGVVQARGPGAQGRRYRATPQEATTWPCSGIHTSSEMTRAG